MNNIIYILSGILILLSLQLVKNTIRNKNKKEENIWGDAPVFSHKKQKKMTKRKYPKTAPATYLFRQR